MKRKERENTCTDKSGLVLAKTLAALLRIKPPATLAFIWKELGTNCENQEKAHVLIQAFNCCLQIVAPAVVFKSEAIVHPDEVLKYIDKDECQLSYNPLLMALLWNSLATRKTRLLTSSMKKSFAISDACTWVNYVRCHDDIGWTFDDAVAHEIGINPFDHRMFLNQFYTGRFDGSFANGVPFAENPSNGDCRVCGSLASLCGLEGALKDNDAHGIDEAVKRMLLLYGITFSIGGIPLLYSSDEIGKLNDYSYRNDDSKKHDDRWVNRIAVTNEDTQLALGVTTPSNPAEVASLKVFNGLQQMIAIRKQHAIFGQAKTHILETDNQHCFAFLRENTEGEKLLAICNFSEHPQSLSRSILATLKESASKELLTGETVEINASALVLAPFQQMWLLPA